MMPDGLTYVSSWIEANFDRCWQVMECDDPRKFQDWILSWNDLMDFEIVPVVPSAETQAAVEGHPRRGAPGQPREDQER